MTHRFKYAALALAALLVAGCEPSPASRTVRATADEAPAPAESRPVQRPPVPLDAAIETAVPMAAPASSLAAGFAADGSLTLLGSRIEPGSYRRLLWSASQIFEGVDAETPVLVVNGREPGPTVCLTAAIHGDELNGIEMVRRVLHDLDPQETIGAVIGIPIVNLQGFRRGSRYLPDRRDLNRFFPGNPSGSSASRIAHSLFQNIIRHCDALVDLHTGSFHRTNLPQLRADLRYAEVRDLTLGFGGMVVMQSVAATGTLRRAATDAGIPAVTLEAGEPLRLQSNQVSQGVTGIFKLLANLDVVQKIKLLGNQEPVFYRSTWVRADHGGILFGVVRLGQVVATGDILGTITDPITNEQNLIYSPADGRVLGMALNQVVMPGFAAFRIGMETNGPEVAGRMRLAARPDGWGARNGAEPAPAPAVPPPDKDVEEASE